MRGRVGKCGKVRARPHEMPEDPEKPEVREGWNVWECVGMCGNVREWRGWAGKCNRYYKSLVFYKSHADVSKMQ